MNYLKKLHDLGYFQISYLYSSDNNFRNTNLIQNGIDVIKGSIEITWIDILMLKHEFMPLRAKCLGQHGLKKEPDARMAPDYFLKHH